jgi:glucuronate isomerase
MTKKMNDSWKLHPDRCFSPDPGQRALARQYYDSVKDLPIVSPHGHVDPALLADENTRFGTPVDLLVIPDHYVFRMLYSQGVPMESLGVPTRDGSAVEKDHRRIWHIFAENFHLFQGNPSGLWLKDELANVFEIKVELNGENAQKLYDQLSEKLASPEYSPRNLFKRFKIEVLSTTDHATSNLEWHQKLQNEGWKGKVIPTFRPDGLLDLRRKDWRQNLDQLSLVSKVEIMNFQAFLYALEERRSYFKSLGAVATDHAVLEPYTGVLSAREVDAIFQHALKNDVSPEDAARFMGHMLVEMAGMSSEDGLVMQLHPGALRDHNDAVYQRFGVDKGADIPVRTEFTRNLRPLLSRFGNDPTLTLVLFTLDESAYSRELAPLAGHYPCLRLGPPWWFHDSPNGIRRYLDQVVETAGIYNLAGFNDDTRAFCSIPTRHDTWRRVTCDWLSGEVMRGLIDATAAPALAFELAVGRARQTYHL